MIVEHTSINPNQAAHIGHVRNSILGDTFVRLLQARGHEVLTQNYIDDTGVQVADVIVGFEHLEKESLAEIRALDARFHYYCWDLYARVFEWYGEDKERKALQAATLHAIEKHDGATAELGEYVAARIVRAHIATMARLDIGYDLLVRESDILRQHFWARAFELLKETKAIEFENEGKGAGCWVSVFFIGVGSLVERTGTKFKSDEKALALIAKARQAIGGDAAVSSVQSMVIVGKTTRQMKINGVAQPQEGETEIAVQFPDKMSRTMKMGHGDPNVDAVKIFDKQVDVVVVGGDKDNMKVIVNGEGHGEGTGANISKKIVVKKGDGPVLELTGADADKWIAEHPGVPGEKHVIIKKGDGDVQEFKTSTSDKVIVRDGNGGNATFTTKDGTTFDIQKGDHTFMRTAGGHGDAARQNDLLRLSWASAPTTTTRSSSARCPSSSACWYAPASS